MLLLLILLIRVVVSMNISLPDMTRTIGLALAIMLAVLPPTSDSHAADPGPPGSFRSRSPSDLAKSDDNGPGNGLMTRPSHLREGTLVPPTSGRIVLIGRRWAFVSDTDENRALVPVESSSSPRTTVNFGGQQSFADPREDDPKSNQSPSQLLITENLMLQRLVEAIRDDTSDDHWTISGEVTEFFDQNRLTIRTAQRANSN